MKRKNAWWDTYCDGRHFRIQCKTKGAACHQTLKHMKTSKRLHQSERDDFADVQAEFSKDQRD